MSSAARRIPTALLISTLWVTAGWAQRPAPRRPAPRALAAVPAQTPQSKGIWEPVNYGEDVELNDVYFVTPDEGWVSGGVGLGGGVLLHTADGGEHWEVVLGDPAGNQRP